MLKKTLFGHGPPQVQLLMLPYLRTQRIFQQLMLNQFLYGKMTPLLTAALKELITKVETLEAKVSALEGS